MVDAALELVGVVARVLDRHVQLIGGLLLLRPHQRQRRSDTGQRGTARSELLRQVAAAGLAKFVEPLGCLVEQIADLAADRAA